MEPINSIIWVTKSKYEVLLPEVICKKKVGEKAFGLATLPSPWTLPFFVVSDDILDEYQACNNNPSTFNSWKNSIEKASVACGIQSDDLIIVRSNARTEGLDERGKYTSVEGVFNEWPDLIQKCFKELTKDSVGTRIKMPLIIQKRVKPLLRGHISNERRVAQEVRDWKGEIDTSFPQIFSVSLRKWRSKLNISSFIDSPLICPSDREIKDVLTIPCTWATNKR